jgi:hypothetical protein
LKRSWFHAFGKIVVFSSFGDTSPTVMAPGERERGSVATKIGSREFALRCRPVYLLTETSFTFCANPPEDGATQPSGLSRL